MPAKLDTTDLQKKFNLSHDDVMKFRNRWRHHGYYTNGRVDSNNQPIEFKISLVDWMTLWIDSGKWASRGVGSEKYVMSRFNDLGHYEKGNVFIQSFADNMKEVVGKYKYPGKGLGHAVSNATKEKLVQANGTPVTINGMIYQSGVAARKALGIGYGRLQKLLKEQK